MSIEKKLRFGIERDRDRVKAKKILLLHDLCPLWLMRIKRKDLR